MSDRIDITLKDLAQLALGGPTFTESHMFLLETLLEVVMEKMNCRNETLTVSGGLNVNCLQEMLKTAAVSPVALNTNKVIKTAIKLQKIDILKARAVQLEENLDKHIKDAQRHAPYNYCQLTKPSTDLCSLCDPYNLNACKLVTNCNFMTNLTKIIAQPVVKRLLAIEDKLRSLNNKLTLFKERISREYDELEQIEDLMSQADKVRQQAEQLDSLFIRTMEEVQTCIDSKMDRAHYPRIKKFITDQFADWNERLKKIKAEIESPKAAGTIYCKSQRKPCTITELKDDEKEKLQKNLPQKYCGCKSEELELEPKQKIPVKMCSLKKDFKPMQFIKGTDGGFYRKE